MCSKDIAEERKSIILAAVDDLVARHGFDALRLRRVASRAGISVGMIQHYFPSRSELMFAALRQSSINRAAVWAQVRDTETRGIDQVVRLLERSISDHHRCAVWLETCSAAVRYPELRIIVDETQKLWHHHLTQSILLAIDQNDLAPAAAVEDLVALLVSIIDGLMLAIATDERAEDNQQGRVALLRQVFFAVLKPTSQAQPLGFEMPGAGPVTEVI